MKKGRTKLISLTQKFYSYFDVPPDKLKEKFSKVEQKVALVDEKGHKNILEEYTPEKIRGHLKKEVLAQNASTGTESAPEHKEGYKSKGLYPEGIPKPLEAKIEQRVQEIVKGEPLSAEEKEHVNEEGVKQPQEDVHEKEARSESTHHEHDQDNH